MKLKNFEKKKKMCRHMTSYDVIWRQIASFTTSQWVSTGDPFRSYLLKKSKQCAFIAQAWKMMQKFGNGQSNVSKMNGFLQFSNGKHEKIANYRTVPYFQGMKSGNVDIHIATGRCEI